MNQKINVRKKITELSREQMYELKQAFLTDAAEFLNLSCGWRVLTMAPFIPDELMYALYREFTFSDADFNCSTS